MTIQVQRSLSLDGGGLTAAGGFFDGFVSRDDAVLVRSWLEFAPRGNGVTVASAVPGTNGSWEELEFGRSDRVMSESGFLFLCVLAVGKSVLVLGLGPTSEAYMLVV